MFLGQYEKSLKYYKKYVERLKALGNLDINNMHMIGYAYWQNRYKEEAEYYFNEQINYNNQKFKFLRCSIAPKESLWESPSDKHFGVWILEFSRRDAFSQRDAYGRQNIIYSQNN